MDIYNLENEKDIKSEKYWIMSVKTMIEKNLRGDSGVEIIDLNPGNSTLQRVYFESEVKWAKLGAGSSWDAQQSISCDS